MSSAGAALLTSPGKESSNLLPRVVKRFQGITIFVAIGSIYNVVFTISCAASRSSNLGYIMTFRETSSRIQKAQESGGNSVVMESNAVTLVRYLLYSKIDDSSVR